MNRDQVEFVCPGCNQGGFIVDQTVPDSEALQEHLLICGQEERELVCAACGYETRKLELHSDLHAGRVYHLSLLCRVCASTLVGTIAMYPDAHRDKDVRLYQTLAYTTNMVLDEMNAPAEVTYLKERNAQLMRALHQVWAMHEKRFDPDYDTPDFNIVTVIEKWVRPLVEG